MIAQLVVEYKDVLKSIDQNIESLAKLSPKYIMKFTKEDAQNVGKTVGIDDSDLLYCEVELFKKEISNSSTISTANEYIHERKSSMPLLNQAYQYLLTLPVTVASVERSFSKMKIVKSRLRTKMDDERLNSLLICTLETDILDQLNDEEVVEKWLDSKAGRRV